MSTLPSAAHEPMCLGAARGDQAQCGQPGPHGPHPLGQLLPEVFDEQPVEPPPTPTERMIGAVADVIQFYARQPIADGPQLDRLGEALRGYMAAEGLQVDDQDGDR